MRVPTRVYVMRGLRVEGARTVTERVLLWSVERLTVRLATDVVCVSPSLSHEAAARHLFGRKEPVVIGSGSSNGVDSDRWDKALAAVDRDAVRKGWQIGSGEFVVGYVGRIVEDKGVGDLLAAFASLSDLPARLVLVGPLDDEGLGSQIAALEGRAVHVDLMTDVAPVYSGIDLLCLPTRREGFPNVVLEAALAEVPTLTTTATGARDSVLPGVTGWLVPVGDVAQLADALRSCAADRGRLREAGRAARERALEEFRPERIWSGLESLYLRRPAVSPDAECAPPMMRGQVGHPPQNASEAVEPGHRSLQRRP
jgi:glycosyltransferase involved in cell wall biosynthesis